MLISLELYKYSTTLIFWINPDVVDIICTQIKILKAKSELSVTCSATTQPEEGKRKPCHIKDLPQKIRYTIQAVALWLAVLYVSWQLVFTTYPFSWNLKRIAWILLIYSFYLGCPICCHALYIFSTFLISKYMNIFYTILSPQPSYFMSFSKFFPRHNGCTCYRQPCGCNTYKLLRKFNIWL